MEVTWYGRTCIRIRGKDAVVVADPYQSVVGPTGRGITGDIVTFSHPDDRPLPKAKGRKSRDGSTFLPSSLDDAFVLDGPGEYEVKEVLITGVRTYRDDDKGATAGKGVAFVVEVDGVHTIHLGEIAHLLTEQGIAVRAGHHCAMPLPRDLGLEGAIRVSLGLYNDSDDLQRFFEALDQGLELLR